jgi:uncharacterized protein YukE
MVIKISPGTDVGSGFQVSRQVLQRTADDLGSLAGMVRALTDEISAACTAGASACPGWQAGAASSASAGRWHQQVTTLAATVTGAGDRLASCAANYSAAETATTAHIASLSVRAR